MVWATFPIFSPHECGVLMITVWMTGCLCTCPKWNYKAKTAICASSIFCWMTGEASLFDVNSTSPLAIYQFIWPWPVGVISSAYGHASVYWVPCLLWLISTLIVLDRLLNCSWTQLALLYCVMATTLLGVSQWTQPAGTVIIEEPGQPFLTWTM